MSRTALVLPSLLLLFALNACGAADDESAPEPTGASSPGAATTPAEPTAEAPTADEPTNEVGPLVEGTAYSFHAPAGWGPSEQPDSGKAWDSAANDLAEDAKSNMSVIRAAGDQPDLAQITETARKDMSDGGATNIELVDGATLDGEPAVHLAMDLPFAESATADQFHVVHDGQHHIITFILDAGVDPAERAAVIRAVIDSWRWA